MLFYFFMCDDLPLINTMQKTLKPTKKNVSMPRMGEKKATECSKHLRHIVIEKDILSELNRCISQISLKYIKLVIPKILFILVLCSFNFYFKIT